MKALMHSLEDGSTIKGRAVRNMMSIATLKKLELIMTEYSIFSFVSSSLCIDMMWLSLFRYILSDNAKYPFVITESAMRIHTLIEEHS